MLINPSRLTIGCEDAVNVCRSLEWARYANTLRASGAVFVANEVSPFEFSLPGGCGPAVDCCCGPDTGAQSPFLTGAGWADPLRPASYEAFGAVIEEASLSGVEGTEEYEFTVTLIPYANTQEGILHYVRWLRGLTNFCGGWPDVSFAEHCVISTRPQVCSSLLQNPLVPEDGQRTMVDAKLVAFKDDPPQFNGQVWVTRLVITWRSAVPLFCTSGSIAPANLQSASPSPTPACLYSYSGSGGAPRRRYLTGNPIDFVDPDSVRNPVWFRLGCIPLSEAAAVDVTINNTRSASLLANLRIELRTWDPRHGAPTTVKLRKLLSEELPCAVALVGRVESGEAVCVSSSRQQILGNRGGQTLEEIGTVLGNLGGSISDWLVMHPRRPGDEWILVAWPSGEQHPTTLAEFTPAQATITVSVAALKERV